MRNSQFLRQLSSLALMALSTSLLFAQSTNVLTWRNNNFRDGQNSTETLLTQTNVTKKGGFGKICSTASGAIDGQLYAQPLVVTGSITGYNHVVYVATLNDSVYAIDGDSTNCVVITHASLLQAQEEAVQCGDVGTDGCGTFYPIIGILGTPVIDISSNTMYLVTWSESTAGACATTKSSSCFVHRLHALDISNLSEKFGGPVTIPTETSGTSVFRSYNHLQRPGLLLLTNVKGTHSGVYIAFSSMDGGGTVGKSVPNGWIYSYDATNLSLLNTWTSTPNGEGGGIWMSGAGIAAGVDEPGGSNYLYLPTGDGTFDAENGGSDYGDSFVKLTTNLTVSNYFSPYNQYCDDIGDVDLGSGGVMLIPNGIASSIVDYALVNGKDGNIYVVERTIPGGYSGPMSNICPTSGTNFNLEFIPAATTNFYSTAAYWNSNIYSVANDAALQKYKISATCSTPPICTPATASSTATFGYGPVPVTSSNANTSGTAIVWLMRGGPWPEGNWQTKGWTPPRAILYAFDAEHVTAPSTLPQLWNSSNCPSVPPGWASKFTVPTVANGRVFIGTMDPTDASYTRGEVDVYGNPGTCD